MNKINQLPIYEEFHSWQGEGFHLGRSAYFIRCYGCPVHCPWCDSAGTWHSDYIPKTIIKKIPEKLILDAIKTNPDFIVVTGGEPCIHDLSHLCSFAKHYKIPIHLETSGSFEIKGNFDWITISPKIWKLPIKENLDKADEIKIIVDSSNAIADWLKRYPSISNAKHVWLHPEWSKKDDSSILNSITDWVKSNGHPYRAGYQNHKLFNADAEDPKTLPEVPLGGTTRNGLTK